MPIWITSAGNSNTFVRAGSIGANVLTHLVEQDTTALANKIRLYREARSSCGLVPEQGKVSLMLHTFVGKDADYVRAKVKGPLKQYIKSSVLLQSKALQGTEALNANQLETLPEEYEDDLEDLIDITFERYYNNASLLGTVDSCRETVKKMKNVGVDEIACLIDFGIDDDDVIDNFEYLYDLKKLFEA